MTATRGRRGWVVRGVASAFVAFGIAATLQGCPLLLIGAAAGAGGGALVATDRRTVGTQADDREIQIRSAAQLAGDLPQGSHVDVAVFNRRVLVVGEVPTPEAKDYATAIIRNVADVESIVNELSVQPASTVSVRSNDTFITSKVKSSLIADKHLSANNFKVVTERGVVYLMGLVTRAEGARAADIASRVPGVVQVVKTYQYILPSKTTDDAFMATSPERNASPDSTSATPGGDPSAGVGNADTAGVTTGAIPSAGVTSEQLQSPAPVGDAHSPVAGNPKSTKLP
ncbi:BON domain-containing protein [Robbsia andropogonis]|uniref:BON domain-containing protein n=1 Tax=Robbsia andropogonis TaxID=28092 RepID=UPI000464FD7A|nr:BON domain-containing protein [Robbsia andropogonis]MCP1117909.1 BON domain-containing protein [Robbsia andropogonis]MCP1127373.1 BON domain-containing protein [Robbsia andropogonis]